MSLQRLWVVVRSQDDAHSGLLQAIAQATGAGEKICGEELRGLLAAQSVTER
ncbi:hypothetical protein AB0I34_32560 [Kribbella sp. NPDC050281]|uniref:hypothetical protein n=1 Tax=Kribbella sp. NPDC050281 TaxID=3155515 RepID=UPI0033D55846